MKNLTKVGLGVLTSIGGFLEVGSLGTALQAGARYRYGLLWALALGTICVAFLTEMTGRLAAVSRHTMVDAMRKRFGVSFQIWPLMTQVVVDLLVLASEIGGASLALQLGTGVPMAVWAVPVALLVWALLWFGTFESIEHGVAALGLVTLSFVAAAVVLGPDWRDAARNLLPHTSNQHPAQYAYLAVGILGATISPYLITFYSSGGVEERWKPKDLMPNRVVAAVGMSFGSVVAMAAMIVAALVLAPRGVRADTYQQSAFILTIPFPRWGWTLFWTSLFIGCVGAALELSLDVAYTVSQSFGWDWGESQRPHEEARFAIVYSLMLLVAPIPALAGLDPLKFTMFSMAVTVVALPIVIGPLLVIMNDTQYLGSHTNGIVGNVAVAAIVALAFVLAVVAIPLQIAGGG
ncbi:MAG TPA: divalent metal cation transporter [Vicinamibacterales bacterium]|nr:divalent metal cation transporter [Vicinamibacterales bacterium]